MINLLPSQEKRMFQYEYWMRFCTVAFFLIALGGVVACLLLIPAYVLSNTKVVLAENKRAVYIDTHTIINTEDPEALINDINTSNTLLRTISSTDVASLIGSFVSTRPEQVTFSRLYYIEKANGTRTLELDGTASNRAILRAFKTDLTHNTHVMSIDIPVSNFLNPTKNDFSISLMIQ